MSRLSKVGLVCGYAALAAAAVVAHLSPTSGYELSIYTATPTPYWVAVAVALFVSILVAFTSTGVLRTGSLVLAVASLYSIGSLPLARGYHFYGSADAMTHLGWTADIFTGRLPVLELYYPGLHTTTLLTSLLSSIPTRRAMLLFVSLFLLAFVAFSFLAVRAITTRQTDTTFAVFAALLLLPITHLTTHYIDPHPISDAILLIPLGLYLLARYITDSERDRPLTKLGILLAIYSTATLLYHSMQALHLLILLGGIVVIQLYVRTRSSVFESATASLSRITEHRPVYVQTGFLAGLFLLWNLNRERTVNAAEGFVSEFSSLLAGTGESATYVQSRGSSLSAIGGDLIEVFAKMFLPSAIFCAITGVLMIGVFFGRLDQDSDADAFVEYLCAALVGLLVFDVLLLIAGDTSDLFFRTLGAVMAVVTVLTVFAVPRLLEWAPISLPTTPRRIAGMVAVGLLLTASIPTVYASPYIFQTNSQVTEQQMTGHEILFEHEMDDSQTTALRNGPWRYYHAIYGVENTEERVSRMKQSGVPFGSLGELQATYATDHYVALRESDRQREAGVYRGLRYDAESFESLDWQPNVHRVTSNGGFRAYLVDKGGSA